MLNAGLGDLQLVAMPYKDLACAVILFAECAHLVCYMTSIQ
jgi:hypothetical protein